MPPAPFTTMTSKYPTTPFPLVGEIVYECAVRSGLVRSNEVTDGLYDQLKAFKDDRKRPGLRPIEFPQNVLTSLDRRLTEFMRDEVGSLALSVAIRDWLSWYAGLVARSDATLLDRETMVEKILWPSVFADGAARFLSVLAKLYPVADPKSLLAAPAPLGMQLRQFCSLGREDFKAICLYRAKKEGIDPENCRKTLDQWLSGKAIPNLDRCIQVLDALGLGEDVASRVWLFVSRLLANTSQQRRALIADWLSADEPLPNSVELFNALRKKIAWDVGAKLSIGPDRPYARLQAALYDPSVPRDPVAIEDMLRRLECTWAPISAQTSHIVSWLRGRYLVLSGRYEEAFEHYLAAYNCGVGRDPDVYRKVIDEAMALAWKVGNMRAVERFQGWLGLYWTTEWDGAVDSLPEHFRRKFPDDLCFSSGVESRKSPQNS